MLMLSYLPDVGKAPPDRTSADACSSTPPQGGACATDADCGPDAICICAGSNDLAGAAHAAFDDALAARPRGEISDAADTLAGHGFAGDWLRREIRSRALADAVAPCARALLARADMAA